MRLAIVAGVLLVGAPVQAEQRTEIINVAGCASILWPSQGYVVLDQSFETSNGVENDGPNTAALLCDAELPVEATVFDSAELESISGGDSSATLTVLIVGRVAQPDGALVSQMQEVGSCSGGDPTWGPLMPNLQPPVSVCQAEVELDIASLEAAEPSEQPSILFLVTLPSSALASGGGGTGWAQAFRIVEHFDPSPGPSP